MAKLNLVDGHGQKQKLSTPEKKDDLLYTVMEKKKSDNTNKIIGLYNPVFLRYIVESDGIQQN